MADDVMAEGDLAEALRRLMERGWRTGDPTRGDLAGLRDLMDRLERRREAMLERYGLGDVLGDIRRELDEIVAQERAGRGTPPRRRRGRAGSGRCRDAARERPRGLGPGRRPGPAPDAARRRRQAARPARRAAATTSASGSAGCASTTSSSRRRASASTSWSSGSSSRCSTSTSAACPTRSARCGPEDLAANREMVRDLNDLIRQRIGGADPDVSRVPREARRVLPGRAHLRRHHRAARLADGRDAVAAPVDAPGAAGRAPVDDGGPAAGRPPARRPRPARLEPRPAAAGRPRRAPAVQRRRAARSRGRSRPDRPARSDGPPRRRALRRGRPGRPRRPRPRGGPRPAGRRRACATSTRSTPWRGGSRPPAT